jgi:hypothetical protein
MIDRRRCRAVVVDLDGSSFCVQPLSSMPQVRPLTTILWAIASFRTSRRQIGCGPSSLPASISPKVRSDPPTADCVDPMRADVIARGG